MIDLPGMGIRHGRRDSPPAFARDEKLELSAAWLFIRGVLGKWYFWRTFGRRCGLSVPLERCTLSRDTGAVQSNLPLRDTVLLPGAPSRELTGEGPLGSVTSVRSFYTFTR